MLEHCHHIDHHDELSKQNNLYEQSSPQVQLDIEAKFSLLSICPKSHHHLVHLASQKVLAAEPALKHQISRHTTIHIRADYPPPRNPHHRIPSQCTMREGSSSPPPPVYRASLPPGHQDLTLNNPPTYREDEQHLLPQHQENAAKPKSKQPLIRLRNFGYQATLWKWVASIVVLGVSASSVSEDGLSGIWLAAMAYNLFCVRCRFCARK